MLSGYMLNTGCSLLFYTDFLWLFHDRKLHKSINHRHWIGGSSDCQRLLATKNRQVVESHCQLFSHGCRWFNAQWITGFTLRLIICANSDKNTMSVQSLPMTFCDLCYFPWLPGLENSLTKYHDYTLYICRECTVTTRGCSRAPANFRLKLEQTFINTFFKKLSKMKWSTLCSKKNMWPHLWW